MLKSSYEFEELGMMSQIIRDLIAQHPTTKEFVSNYFSLESVLSSTTERKYTASQRKVLSDVLKKQNTEGGLVQKSVELIGSENTFTITTGHQLNLMGSPLYSIYKICQVIGLTRELNESQHQYNYVPLFWMATEDHDFEEINHIHLFGQTLSWDVESNNKITGEIPIQQIEDFLGQVEGKFNDPVQLQIVQELTSIYRHSETLSEAHAKIIKLLFKDTELLVLDAHDAKLKEMFAPIAKQEVLNQFVHSKVSETNQLLDDNGYHQQVYLRECNLFFIDENNVRHRIEFDQEVFKINDQSYTSEELVAMIDEKPEQFSPNALMRPMYQECALPNVVYLGGGGEIAYWLQLKAAFEHVNLSFPILKVRHSALLMNKKQIELLNDFEVELLDVKLGVDNIVKQMAIEEAGNELDLEDVYSGLDVSRNTLLNKAASINKGLNGMIEAEFAKFNKSIQKIEQRLIKEEKGKFEKTEKQLKRLSDQLFPNNGFQERYENILPYLVKDQAIIDKILANFEASKNSCIEIIEL